MVQRQKGAILITGISTGVGLAALLLDKRCKYVDYVPWWTGAD